MVTVLIVLAIGIYTGFVIHRQIQNWKSGKFCNCDGQGCAGSCQKNIKD